MDPSVLLLVDEAIEAAFGLVSIEANLDSPPTITNAISEGSGSIKTGRYEL